MKTCKRCNKTKELPEFARAAANRDGHNAVCKPCIVQRNTEYWRTPKGRMSYIYNGQKQSSSDRGHPPPDYTQAELTSWALANGLEQLVYSWEQKKYLKDYAPSVDRIDDSLGYSFSNIRLVTWKDNNEKMYQHRKEGKRITRQNRRVEQLSLDGRPIAFYPSIALAARTTGVTRTNINRMCVNDNPNVKSVGGFLWRYG